VILFEKFEEKAKKYKIFTTKGTCRDGALARRAKFHEEIIYYLTFEFFVFSVVYKLIRIAFFYIRRFSKATCPERYSQ
jgi:hypothetical protein